MALEWALAFIGLGAFAGFMAGLLGVGGGGIMVPLLTTIFLGMGIVPDNVVHLALGTSMATIVTTSFSSMRAHHANGAVLWDIVKRMAPAVIVGTFLATFVAAQIPSLYLAVFFALFMGYVSVQMLLNKKPSPSHKPASSTELLGVGAGIGAISALVSIGGGSLTVPYLTWRNFDIKKAIGTSAAMGLPISLAGALGYLLNHDADLATIPYTVGLVYWPAVLLMSACSFFTAPLGAKLAHRLPVATLKKLFAILLLLLSLKMLTALL
ncbi:hypothetical protein BKE30_05635 [Alkanindiges hydrocarboniclasticus]|jgi:uncharacterized protein|uniref:Probable membrane transporter protein n=1 Tax=Alkanindiges hydrocarboniclasticus TaxID=1907941 RepID=A0A1S8CXQ1_9GAMM|nr:sulfite exporter TauE/SafE family protein [Alkanindiges hydrocarboniclasticus]ONG41260.1 hypothetical protein BKE30_05635 [Alkanindiges hydrocarboniclasticus]